MSGFERCMSNYVNELRHFLQKLTRFITVLSAVGQLEGRHYRTDGLESTWPLGGALSFGQQSIPHYPMSEHRAEGSRKKSVSCSYCDKKFWNKSDCHGHINSQHLKLKPFVCRKCAQTFSYKQSLKSHEMFCQLEKC